MDNILYSFCLLLVIFTSYMQVWYGYILLDMFIFQNEWFLSVLSGICWLCFTTLNHFIKGVHITLATKSGSLDQKFSFPKIQVKDDKHFQ